MYIYNDVINTSVMEVIPVLNTIGIFKVNYYMFKKTQKKQQYQVLVYI